MRYGLRNRFVVILAVCCIGLWLASAEARTEGDQETATHARPLAKQQTLVIGKVSSNPKKHYKYLKPMVDYMVQHLRHLGITEGRVLMAKDNQEMMRYLQEGKVDWVTETVFSALLFVDQGEAEILLRKWKKGVPDYHTVFVTRKDSGIHALADLKGRTIAFEDPGSTTAYFVPKSELIQQGLQLVPLSSPRDVPPTDKVGYVFAREEINMATWVYRGLVDAAAYNNLDWNKEDHTPPKFKKDMRIFHHTQPFPRAVELVRKRLDPRIKARLKAVLLNAHNDPEAKTVLKSYQKTTKFDTFTGEAQQGLQEAQRILQSLEPDLGR